MKAFAASLAPMRTRADHSTYSAQPEGKSQHGRIVSELGLAIVGGELQPGDKLPPEAQLADDAAVLALALRLGAVGGMVRSGSHRRQARD